MKRYGENGWIDFGRRWRAMIIPISINFQIDGGNWALLQKRRRSGPTRSLTSDHAAIYHP
jgi:hypothetical protein